MKKHIFAAFFLLALGSCASRPPVHVDPARTQLFPWGVYKHWVTLEIVKKDKIEKHSFLGVVDLSEDENRVVGLSPFGTSVFRIIETKRPQPKIESEIYLESMKAFEPRLREIYGLLKTVMELPRNSEQSPSGIRVLSKSEDNFPQEVECFVMEKPTRIRIDEYGTNTLPTRFSIHHPNFKIAVKVGDFRERPVPTASH